jgi:hypothetical protein
MPEISRFFGIVITMTCDNHWRRARPEEALERINGLE